MNTAREVRQESDASMYRIVATLAMAVLLKQIPWSGWGLILRPDFLLVVLLWWALHRPSRVGMGLAFTLGLFSDFQDGAVFGQHAVAYTLGAYAVQYFRLRFLQFDALRQAAQMLPIFLMAQLVILMTGWLAAHPPRGIDILLPGLSGAATWYFLAVASQLLYGKRSLHQ